MRAYNCHCVLIMYLTGVLADKSHLHRCITKFDTQMLLHNIYCSQQRETKMNTFQCHLSKSYVKIVFSPFYNIIL